LEAVSLGAIKSRNIRTKAITWATGLLITGSIVIAQSPVFTEYPLPLNSAPFGITAGPDGNLWFTEYSGNKIGKITTAGVVSEFALPTVNSRPYFITAGPDGNLWFTEAGSPKVGRITTAGVITEFSVPANLLFPGWIVTGPDGNLWFTGDDYVGKITTAGVVTEIFIGNTPASGITLGPDGNLWFTTNDAIERITPAGSITKFPLPAMSGAAGITSGPDGNLWYLDQGFSKIGRMTIGGVFTIFAIPSPDQGGPNCTVNCGLGDQPEQITPGPDGNLWFTEQLGSKGIGKVTTSGVITEFQVPTPGSVPFGITAGPDGNMWFTEASANKIGRVTLAVLPSPTPIPASLLLVFTGMLALMCWSGWRALRYRSL
jgi:streptogramin lyase